MNKAAPAAFSTLRAGPSVIVLGCMFYIRILSDLLLRDYFHSLYFVAFYVLKNVSNFKFIYILTDAEQGPDSQVLLWNAIKEN